MYGTLYSGDPTAVNDSIPQMTPGAVVRAENGKKYRYVKLIDESVTPAIGQPVWWSDTDATMLLGYVTNDFDQGYGVNAVAGVLVSAPTEGNWCLVQTDGPCTVLNDGTDISAGLTVAATGDGICALYTLTGNAQSPSIILGYAPVAITGTSGTIMLTLGA